MNLSGRSKAIYRLLFFPSRTAVTRPPSPSHRSQSFSRVCPLCDGIPTPAGSRYTTFSNRTFHYGYCSNCNLGLVLDPRTDYDALYNDAYYAGNGADPLVNYSGDDVGRNLEFEGLEKTGRFLNGGNLGQWLDFGGGLGHFASYLREVGWEAWACDEGLASTELKSQGLNWDPGSGGSFNVVSAIEVVEHLVDPLPVLRTMANQLAPGGVLLITTGNLDKAPPLHIWQYATTPDLHVTFWTPTAWSRALTEVGLHATPPVQLDAGITQYKVIKSLPRFSLSRFRRPLARFAKYWRGPAILIDRKYGVSSFPVGRKPTDLA